MARGFETFPTMQRVLRMPCFISQIAMAQKMATTNPIDQLLSSDVDESVISALVGSLESRLASPTSKDSPQQHSTTSVNNNHIDGVRVGNATSTLGEADTRSGQKPGLIQNISEITSNASNGSTESISQSQLLGLNSILGTSTASVNSTTGVSLLSSVNSHSASTGATTASSVLGSNSVSNVKFATVANSSIKAEQNANSTAPGGHKQVIVTVGSNNQGTVLLGTAQNNVHEVSSLQTQAGSIPDVATNSVVNTSGTTSIAGSAIHHLASIAAEQQPLVVPTTAQGKLQGTIRAGQLTVREQLEKQQQKDIKSTLPPLGGGVNLNVVNAVAGSTAQTVQGHTQVKQELKVLPQSQTLPVANQQQTINIVTSGLKSTTVAPNTPGVFTITKHVSNQTMTVVRPQTTQPGLPPGTPTIQIVNVTSAPRMAGTTTQPKVLAPRTINTPVRIATVSQQPQVRTQGNMVSLLINPILIDFQPQWFMKT